MADRTEGLRRTVELATSILAFVYVMDEISGGKLAERGREALARFGRRALVTPRDPDQTDSDPLPSSGIVSEAREITRRGV